MNIVGTLVLLETRSAHLFDQLACDGMEARLIRLERLLCKLVVHLIHQSENGTAKLHAAFEWANDPLGRHWCKVRGGGAAESQFIPAQSDFCIVCSCEAVYVGHVVDVSCRKGCTF